MISQMLYPFTESTRMQFFKSVAQALVDFNELNPIAPLQLLLEVIKIYIYIFNLFLIKK